MTPTAGLTTTEAGGTASFSVVLTSRPTADVTIAITSSAPGEGTASVSSLTFTAADWDVPQVVTITGRDDDVDDGDVMFTIAFSVASGTEMVYAGIDPADASVVNVDDDIAGIIVVSAPGPVTSEAGGTATFAVVLGSRPTADVIVTLNSGDPTEGTISVASLTFTPDDWDIPQYFTVTGIDDSVDDGDITYSIVVSAATSEDPLYSGLAPTHGSVINIDDDTAGVTVATIGGLTLTEAGGMATFAVVLDSQPSSEVVIRLGSSDAIGGVVSLATLIFTPENWDTPQTVTLAVPVNPADSGERTSHIVVSVQETADRLFAALPPVVIVLSSPEAPAEGEGDVQSPEEPAESRGAGIESRGTGRGARGRGAGASSRPATGGSPGEIACGLDGRGLPAPRRGLDVHRRIASDLAERWPTGRVHFAGIQALDEHRRALHRARIEFGEGPESAPSPEAADEPALEAPER